MNNEVVAKTMGSLRKKNIDIKLLTAESRRNYLVFRMT